MKIFFQSFFDFLFPLSCLSCGREGSLLCDRCTRNLPRKIDLHCPHCQKAITPNGALCHACRGETPLDGVFAASPFRDKLISDIIHTYKYHFAQNLALPLGTFLTESLQRTPLPIPDIILPVPLHHWREQWRGFNQSEHLARIVADTIAPGIPLMPISNPLIRKHFTLPQSRQKNKQARKENLANAFAITPDTPTHFFQGKRIWLVDDVATTGSTLVACATLLKRHGATEVYGITLAS
ncbi:MAG: ComF family protein [Candidatus Moraniibacteriota bacterium]